MHPISPSEHIADIRHELAMLKTRLDVLTVRWQLASLKESLAALEMI
jgi:hypothetical protein